MAWLTDSDRREREWLQQVEGRAVIQAPSLTRVPNGGLHLDWQYLRRGDVRQHHTSEDVAIGEHSIHRVHRGRLSGPVAAQFTASSSHDEGADGTR